MILTSIRFGTNDVEQARSFYDATMAELGVGNSQVPAGMPFLLYDLGGVRLMIGPAANGEPATFANGGTVLFSASSDEAVAAWHAAGLANGGTDEGAPGPRPRAREAFGAYLRDPDGNKLGCYHGLGLS